MAFCLPHYSNDHNSLHLNFGRLLFEGYIDVCNIYMHIHVDTQCSDAHPHCTPSKIWVFNMLFLSVVCFNKVRRWQVPSSNRSQLDLWKMRFPLTLMEQFVHFDRSCIVQRGIGQICSMSDFFLLGLFLSLYDCGSTFPSSHPLNQLGKPKRLKLKTVQS